LLHKQGVPEPLNLCPPSAQANFRSTHQNVAGRRQAALAMVRCSSVLDNEVPAYWQTVCWHTSSAMECCTYRNADPSHNITQTHTHTLSYTAHDIYSAVI